MKLSAISMLNVKNGKGRKVTKEDKPKGDVRCRTISKVRDTFDGGHKRRMKGVDRSNLHDCPVYYDNCVSDAKRNLLIMSR